MKFITPDFSKLYLASIELCGQIAASDVDMAAWNERVSKDAKFESAGRTVFYGLGVSLNRTATPPTSLHFHVAFAVPQYFGGREPPTPNAVEELEAIADKLAGLPVTSNIEASFRIPLAELPRTSIIRPLLDIEAQSNGVGLRLSGSRFDLKPAPLRRLIWSVQSTSGGDVVFVDITGRVTEKIDENYATRALDLLVPPFSAFILANEGSNDRSETGTAE